MDTQLDAVASLASFCYSLLMAEQSFTSEQRFAFWKAYGRKCAYCNCSLTLREVRIEHVIPETLLSKPVELQKILKTLGLAASFDLKSYLNLVVSCNNCNSAKSKLVLPFGAMAIMLTRAGDVAKRVNMLEAEQRKKSREELAKFFLAQARRYGVAATDIREAAMKMLQNSAHAINKQYVEDVLGVAIDELDKERVASLEVRPLFEDGQKILLSDEEGKGREVGTVAEYRLATAEGFYATNTLGIKASTGIIEPIIALLDLLRTASIPDESFVAQPRLGVHSLEYLPGRILDASAEPADAVKNEDSIQTLVLSTAATIGNCGADFIDILHGGFYYRLTEIMRADLDGDGFEDILITKNVDVLGGSLGYTEVLILSRLSAEGSFIPRRYSP